MTEINWYQLPQQFPVVRLKKLELPEPCSLHESMGDSRLPLEAALSPLDLDALLAQHQDKIIQPNACCEVVSGGDADSDASAIFMEKRSVRRNDKDKSA